MVTQVTHPFQCQARKGFLFVRCLQQADSSLRSLPSVAGRVIHPPVDSPCRDHVDHVVFVESVPEENAMHFDERNEGDYRIFAGSTRGDPG